MIETLEILVILAFVGGLLLLWIWAALLFTQICILRKPHYEKKYGPYHKEKYHIEKF